MKITLQMAEQSLDKKKKKDKDKKDYRMRQAN